MNELNLIQKFFQPLAKTSTASHNLSDDAARFSINRNEELIVSTDTLVEDVHFLKSDGGFNIASKLLLTNLSDLAASGAKPLYYTLNFSKNKNLDQKFITDFCRGLSSIQKKFNLSLIGGDTVCSKKLFFSVTIFGTIKKGESLLRSGAKSGDLIFVSGSIGDAFLGLNLKQKKDLSEKHLLSRHFSPTPRIELGKALLKSKISRCAIDVSDGLLSDLRHICTSSKLDAEIHLEKIPISPEAKNFLQKNPGQKNPEIKLLDLISGGDDYELIFTSDKKNLRKILDLQKSLKLDLTCIGTMKKPSGKTTIKSPGESHCITLLDSKQKKITIKKFGYEH